MNNFSSDIIEAAAKYKTAIEDYLDCEKDQMVGKRKVFTDLSQRLSSMIVREIEYSESSVESRVLLASIRDEIKQEDEFNKKLAKEVVALRDENKTLKSKIDEVAGDKDDDDQYAWLKEKIVSPFA